MSHVRAEQRINRAAKRADELQEILNRPIESWSWPIVVDSPDGPVTFDSATDFGFVRAIREFQEDHVARLAGGGAGANFSVPGSGKTAVTLACLGALFDAGAISRAIVVAPISAHESWEVEPGRCFAPGHTPSVSILPTHPDAQIVVYNYEALQDAETLTTVKAWLSASSSAVVFDEGHRAKAGRDGVRGLACLELSAAATHRFVLTGTPAPNAPSDLEAMFDLVWPGQGHSLVRHPHRNRCFVRATKTMLGLPPMRTELERVPMSNAHEQLYLAARNVAALMVRDPQVRDDLAQIGRIVMLLLQAATNPAAVLDPDSPLRMTEERMGVDLDTLAREAATEMVPAKFVRARQLVETNVAEGEKTLMWANFVHHIEDLHALMADYEPAVIMGSVPRLDPSADRDRRRELERFRTDPNCRLLLATPQTLGEGVSLHETCTRQVFVDRTYNAGVYLQALDRIHRLGMDPAARASAKFLVSEGTIDVAVAARLEAKVRTMSRLLDDPDLLTLSLPDFDDTLTLEDLFLDGGNPEDLENLFAHIRGGD